MKTLRRMVMIAGVICFALSAGNATAAALFDKSEYAARRLKLMEKIPDGQAVIFGAQPIGSY